MALTVKPIAASATKFARNASGAAAEYAERAAAAAESWQSGAVAAAGNFRQAVTAGNIEARFRRGVQKAGPDKYRRKIVAVGQSRFSEGVTGAEDEWQAGFEPYHSTIGALTLPARRPRGDVANYQRVQAVGQALSAKRLAMLASS